MFKEYRSQGYGKQMYLLFEKAVKDSGKFSTLCFCKIAETSTHPLMPPNYKPLDSFWTNKGFKKKDITSSVVWRNVYEKKEIPHQLIYWMKPL